MLSPSASSESSISAEAIPTEDTTSTHPGGTNDHNDTSIAPLQTSCEKKEREFMEAECRRQLASLRAADKRRPQAMSADIFATVFDLSREGVNIHKLKIGNDISLDEVESLFGKEKARNGFSLAERLSPALRKEAEKLYCVCYQKPYAANHVAKEFAIGFVLEKVKNKKVNWAAFAPQTNQLQRSSYMRRIRLWITRLAEILEVHVSTLYATKGFTDYVDVKKEKALLVELYGTVVVEGVSQGDPRGPYQCGGQCIFHL
jgi:hypothetical protein